MRSSWKRGFTASLSYAPMASYDVFSFAFLSTLLTTLKSGCNDLRPLLQSPTRCVVFHRCLLACFKFLGRCACPDCLIPKEDFGKMGTRTDMKHRTQQCRVDTERVREDLKTAREFIFKQGRGPESVAIQRLKLGELSMTPTQVRTRLRSQCFELNGKYAGRVFCALCGTWRQPLAVICPRYYARIRSGRVEVSFHASSAYPRGGRRQRASKAG